MVLPPTRPTPWSSSLRDFTYGLEHRHRIIFGCVVVGLILLTCVLASVS